MLAERGLIGSYETIQRWCRKFAQTVADRLRHPRSRSGDHWHLNEMFIRINDVQHYLWRAVDQEGLVLDILVQSLRNTRAAKCKIITHAEHRQSRYLRICSQRRRAGRC